METTSTSPQGSPSAKISTPPGASSSLSETDHPPRRRRRCPRSNSGGDSNPSGSRSVLKNF